MREHLGGFCVHPLPVFSVIYKVWMSAFDPVLQQWPDPCHVSPNKSSLISGHFAYCSGQREVFFSLFKVVHTWSSLQLS